MMTGSNGGFVASQDKGKPTSSEHYKQLKKVIDANVSFRIFADLIGSLSSYKNIIRCNLNVKFSHRVRISYYL